VDNDIRVFRIDRLFRVCVLPTTKNNRQLGLTLNPAISRELKVVSALGVIAEGKLYDVAFANHVALVNSKRIALLSW
jgi:hypothetical protein